VGEFAALAEAIDGGGADAKELRDLTVGEQGRARTLGGKML
jgi:hypothetical protein